MLRVALPNKGMLSQPAREMLAEAGYRRARDPRALVITDHANDVEFFLLRPKDIATYVAAGTLDLGITGRDMLIDSGASAREELQLGFAPSRFFLAAPTGRFATPAQMAGSRIATSYPGLLRHHLRKAGIEAELVRLDGAVENAVRLGVADAIADVVDTGTTLRQAGLETIGDPILESEALLIRRQDPDPDHAADVFIRRLQGVMTARTYSMVDYDIPTDRVGRACDLTPGLESPTVSALHEAGWSAVRAVVPKRDVHAVMDDLVDIGARGVLVTAISACRL